MDVQQRLLVLEAENADLKTENADLKAENADLRRRLAQLEHQLQHIHQRRKRTTAKRPPKAGTPADRRRQEHRQHPGYVRPAPPPDTPCIEHDVHPTQCPQCGSADLDATGAFDDHFVADIPEPKVEWHRYRRRVHRCRQCQRTCQGRGDRELAGAHIGPRARLLTCYGRAHLGISFGQDPGLAP